MVDTVGTARVDIIVDTQSLDRAIETAKSRVSGMTQSAQEAYQRLDGNEKRRINTLLKQADTLGFTRQQQILYNATIKGVPLPILDELKSKLSGAATAQQRLTTAAHGNTKAFSGSAKSSRELQFAMRGLPAQFTDIFTSLASGQRPVMVLLQQGGQLKDMFGGIRPAVSAVGGALLKLLNPLTLTAAAVGAVTFAWFQGRDEAQEFNKALIKTGNISGLTAEQLGDVAEAMDGISGTRNAAAAALAQVVGTGRVATDQLQLVARAVQSAGDQGDKLLDVFIKLGEKPVDTLLELNKAEHFLTLEMYEQIKALEAQGRAREAAKLATGAYADEVVQRAGDVSRNLGYLEQGWKGVKKGAAEAWDAMLAVGRQDDEPSSLSRGFGALRTAADFVSNISSLGAPQGFRSLVGGGAQGDSDREGTQAKAREKARIDALLQSANDVAVALSSQADSFESAEEKRARRIAAVHVKANTAVADAIAAGNRELADKIRTSEAIVVEGIQAEAKPAKKKPGPKSDHLDGLRSLVEASFARNLETGNKALDARAEALRKIGQAGGEAIKQGADVAAVQRLIGIAVENTNRQYDKQAVLLIEKNAVAVAKYRAALDLQNEALKRQIDAQVLSISMNARAFAELQQLAQLREKSAETIRRLEAKRAEGGSDVALLTQQIDAERAAMDTRVRIVEQGFERMEAARADWRNGAKRALDEYVEFASDTAARTSDAWSSGLDGMTDTLTEFFTTGRADWKEFVADILTQIARIQIAKLIAGLATSASTGLSFGTASGSYLAKGGVYDSPSLSRYSGGVYNQPTPFTFAKGMGIFGEAGPEAIMPLKRGPDGKLGVTVSGGGGGSVTVNQTINVDNEGNAEVDTTDARTSEAARQFAQRMRTVAKQAIADEQRPGGSLWRMANA